jgi:hypothetical protein
MRQLVLILSVCAALACGALGVQAYLAEDWQLSSRFFGIGALIAAGVSLAKQLSKRNKINAQD